MNRGMIVVLAIWCASCAASAGSERSAPDEVVGAPPLEPARTSEPVRIELTRVAPATPTKERTRAAVPGRGERITLDVRDAPVVDVLRLLAEHGGFNLVVDDTVTGRVTLRLENVTIEEAFDGVLAGHDLGYEMKGEIYVVE